MHTYIKYFALLLCLFITSMAIAQVPQGIPYQAAARNSGGAILASTAISVRFTIRDSVATGTIKYRETHSITTTDQGLFSLNIGQGTPVSGTFAGINWGSNAKFLQVEIDAAGGSSYVDMGTQQMMSVPYAQYAATSGTTLSGGSGFTHYVGEVWGGGVVYYVYRGSDGLEHGLIVSLTDQSTGMQWSNVTATLIGSTAQSNWNGLANSNAIVAQAGHTNSAAKLCLDLVSGGYSDWYLPSRNELILLYNNQLNVNKTLGTFSGATEMVNIRYWSSSEYDATYAWHMGFSVGGSGYFTKDYIYPVRAVRAF